MNPRRAKILRVHVTERDRHEGMPLHEAIVDICRRLGIAGATVFRGLEGYGDSAEIHRPHLLGRDLPLVVTVVDVPENIERLVAALDPIVADGTLAVSDVEMIRVEKRPDSA